MNKKKLIKHLEKGQFFEFLKNKKKHYDPRGILIGERQGKNLFHVEKVEGGGSITKYLSDTLNKEGTSSFVKALHQTMNQPDIQNGEDTGCGPKELSRGANGVALRVCLNSIQRIDDTYDCETCRAIKLPLRSEGLEDLMIERGVTETLYNGMRKSRFSGWQHIVKPDSIADQKVGILSLELILPAQENIYTVSDLIKDSYKNNYLDEGEWKNIMVQLWGTLSEIRRNAPNFQHNDIHYKNVMLSRWPEEESPQIFRSKSGAVYQAKKGKFFVKIIDFGQTTCDIPTLNTREGMLLWNKWARCPAVDFVRFTSNIYEEAYQIFFQNEKSMPIYMQNFLNLMKSVLEQPLASPRTPPFMNDNFFSYPNHGGFRNTSEWWFRQVASMQASPELLLENSYFDLFKL